MINERIDNLFTYKDYMSFNDDIKRELINGTLYNMSPAPSSIHQRISVFLLGKILLYLNGEEGKRIECKKMKCEVFHAPFDVYFVDENQSLEDCKNILQPDISIICDKKKISEKGCVGAPDFILEITSRFNKAHDYVRKLNVYNNYKVREYWIVNPDNRTILKYLFDEQGFGAPEHYSFSDKVRLEILNNFVIDFTELNI